MFACFVAQIPPCVAVLPLGTGNDLARVLGWGSGYTGVEDIDEILDKVEKAKPCPLDRYAITNPIQKLLTRTNKGLCSKC